MLELRKMNKNDVVEQWKYVTALPADENGLTNQYEGISFDAYRDEVLPKLMMHENPINMPDWFVPITFYYLWDDDIIVGEFHIRHYLCESLINGAGHIGYYIAPEYRKNGYATQGLRLALSIVENIVPEDEIYLRTDKYNTASLKVMLSNGGYIHHEDELKYYVRIKKIIRRYKNESIDY